MSEKYSDDVLNIKFPIEMLDGIKPDTKFFSITEDDLRNVYHVLPSDTEEEARKKIMDIVSKDEFLYKYFNKDPRIWEITSFIPGYWTTPAKEDRILTKDELLAKGFSDQEVGKMRLPVKETEVIQTFQQKLTIKFSKRDLSNIMADERFFEMYDKALKDFIAEDNIYMQMLKNKFAVKPKKNYSSKRRNAEKLLFIPDVELHLGKLASKFDSIDSYDYKKALYRYQKIILEAEQVQEMYNAKEICMTIGNDFFNTDTEQNTTTAGTEQHNDTRFQQMIVNGIAAHIWGVERMKANCDKLILKYNPGNHDTLIDYTLFMQLYYLYRDDPKVEIEPLVKESRWATALVWYNNLIIASHGKTPEGKALNDDALSQLPNKMFKNETKRVKFLYVIAGHLHNATENNFSSRKSASNGVTVLRSGSPSGDGAWDSGNLYSSDKSHQVYVYDAQRGLYATINIRLTEEELEKAISTPALTDDTNYVRVIEKSMALKTEDILTEELKRLSKNNEKQITNINKKYKELLERAEALLNNCNLSDLQKNELLDIFGYNEEIKPYMETRSMLYEKLTPTSKRMLLNKKSE